MQFNTQRLNLKLPLFIISAFSVSLSPQAFLCDNAFYAQSAKQYTYTYSDPASMGAPEIKTLKPNLSDLQALEPSIGYNPILKFSGGCTDKLLKPVTYWSKPATQTTFASRTDSIYGIQINDASHQLAGQKFEYWFGFFKPLDTLRYAIGRDTGKPFMGWYGTYLVSDSSRNSAGIPQLGEYIFPQLYGPLDSGNIYKAITDKLPAAAEAGHTRRYTLQFVGIVYDTLVPVSRRNVFEETHPDHLTVEKMQGGLRLHFSTQATHALVQLYDMFGHQVASLRAEQGAWSWDGKNAQGQNAPGGVYFVRADSRILGKFMYVPRL